MYDGVRGPGADASYEDRDGARGAIPAGGQADVTVNSGSTALELVFRVLAERKRRQLRVAFQGNAFPAPVFSCLISGNEPVFCDIDLQALAPTVVQLQELYARRGFDVLHAQWTGGFVPDHVHKITAWCRERGVIMLEDASQAAGTWKQGYPAGSFGEPVVFSLAGTKALHTGEGGVVVSDDADLIQAVFEMKNYGRNKLFSAAEFVRVGGNRMMSEMQALVGNVIFDSLPGRVKQRHEFMDVYRPYLDGLGLTLLGDWSGTPNLCHVPAMLPDPWRRAFLKTDLEKQQIQLGSPVYDYVTPALQAMGTYCRPEDDFPVTKALADGHICLPIHNCLTVDDVHRVGAALRTLLG